MPLHLSLENLRLRILKSKQNINIKVGLLIFLLDSILSITIYSTKPRLWDRKWTWQFYPGKKQNQEK